MRRTDIPVRLRIARAADIAKIPDTALKAMAPADVAPRLLAADEYRRRAAVPHLDGDLYRHRLSLAREVLATADPKRAAELVKAAGVLAYTLRDGTKVPTSDATELKTAIGVGKRDHRTGLPGDDPAFRRHLIDRAKALNLRQEIPASWGAEYAGKSAKAAPGRAHPGTLLAKSTSPAAAPRSITVPTPALDRLNTARSFEDGLSTLARKGELGIAAKELAAVAAAHGEVTGKSGAWRYERKAALATDPADRQAYLELARREREKAGTS